MQTGRHSGGETITWGSWGGERGSGTQSERERVRCKHIHHMLHIISLCCCNNWLTDWPTGWLTGWLAAILAHWRYWLPHCLWDGMADWLTDCLDSLLTSCCLAVWLKIWCTEGLTGRLVFHWLFYPYEYVQMGRVRKWSSFTEWIIVSKLHWPSLNTLSYASFNMNGAFLKHLHNPIGEFLHQTGSGA